MNILEILTWGLRLAGAGQLFIAGIYFWMRRILDWDGDVAKLRPHNRCIAKTYARYIQAINTVFGLMCLLQPRELLGQTPLAADLTLCIGVYWLGRLLLGIFYYDVSEITSQRTLYRVAKYLFDALFVFQITALLAAFAYDLYGLMH